MDNDIRFTGSAGYVLVCGMQWLRQMLEAAGKKPADLARFLEIPPPRVYEMLAGKRRLQQGEIARAAAFLGIAEGRIVAALDGRPDPGPAIPANAQFAPTAPAPPARADMAKDVPVFGTGMGGNGDADFEMNGQIIDYVRRPPRLAGRNDVFAIYVQGASMSPWREPGELVYVERNRPPRSGDYVVIEFAANEFNVRPALIKKLVAITPSRIKLLQYNPPKTIEIDRQKNRYQLYRVIDWTELMGV